ncbi:MAG: hypothetical protein EPN84_09490 [Legionella sp.]|nr:MAG: hypothetical protein EPN84_09490 [Legionella sp.]
MPFLTVRVSDFDKTLTKEHTFGRAKFYNPQNNTKEGLESIVRHDAENIFAVATHNPNPEYILDYLLPLLKLTREDIIKKVLHAYPTHTITAYYLKNSPHPLLISTVDRQEHRNKGKKIALEDLLKHLPPCDEHIFYDDDPLNIIDACALPQFVVHQVTRTDASFKIDYKQTLISYLFFCKARREEDIREYNGWGSFLSFNLFGFSRTAEIKAADALIEALKSDTPLDRTHIAALSQGRLGTFICQWQLEYGLRWLDLVTVVSPSQNFIHTL